MKCSFNILLTCFGKRNCNLSLQNAVVSCLSPCGFAAIQAFICQTTNRLHCMTSYNTVLCINAARTLHPASKRSGPLQSSINNADHTPYILIINKSRFREQKSHGKDIHNFVFIISGVPRPFLNKFSGLVTEHRHAYHCF